MDTIVTLNVGGSLYTTTRSTLTRYPASMLGAMFSGRLASAEDKNGSVFIDRDGALFKYVLNFLRDGRLHLPENFQDLDALLAEAEFYQIQPMIDEISKRLRHKLNDGLSIHVLIVDDLFPSPVGLSYPDHNETFGFNILAPFAKTSLDSIEWGRLDKEVEDSSTFKALSDLRQCCIDYTPPVYDENYDRVCSCSPEPKAWEVAGGRTCYNSLVRCFIALGGQPLVNTDLDRKSDQDILLARHWVFRL